MNSLPLVREYFENICIVIVPIISLNFVYIWAPSGLNVFTTWLNYIFCYALLFVADDASFYWFPLWQHCFGTLIMNCYTKYNINPDSKVVLAIRTHRLYIMVTHYWLAHFIDSSFLLCFPLAFLFHLCFPYTRGVIITARVYVYMWSLLILGGWAWAE